MSVAGKGLLAIVAELPFPTAELIGMDFQTPGHFGRLVTASLQMLFKSLLVSLSFFATLLTGQLLSPFGGFFQRGLSTRGLSSSTFN